MIFLSAQPDEFYFLWQLQLQVFNFNRLGILKKNIHILIAYDIRRGLSQHFQSFASSCNGAMIYSYPDTRKKRSYRSSVRPHIIAKHFKENKFLEEDAIFYHDSDVIFTKLPAFELLLNDNLWYASDTRSYTGQQYLLERIGQDGVDGMCGILKVKPKLIEINDHNVGGAQYLLKKVNVKFWKRLERNSEVMFVYLNELNQTQALDEKQVQAWCTDMWCLSWDALRQGEGLRISTHLKFDWANTDLNKQIPSAILHYTGDIIDEETRFFRKNDFIRCTPFLADHTKISNDSASIVLVEEIKAYNFSHKLKRIKLDKVSFMFAVKVNFKEQLEDLKISCEYLLYNFEVEILVLEVGSVQHLDTSKLPAAVNYCFVRDENKDFHSTKYINQLLNKTDREIAVIQSITAIIPVTQLLQAIGSIMNKHTQVCYPYSTNTLTADLLLKAVFAKSLDICFFERNSAKMIDVDVSNAGYSLVIDRGAYLRIGGENERIKGIYYSALERMERFKKTGIGVTKLGGNLYNLSALQAHNNDEEKGYTDDRGEYLKVSTMSCAELQTYVSQ